MDRKKEKQYEKVWVLFLTFQNRVRKISLKTIAGSEQKRKYIGQPKHLILIALKVLVLISASSIVLKCVEISISK